MARRRKTDTGGRMTPPVAQPDAAGSDIVATEICGTVSPDRDPQSVRRFESFTPDLMALADWLRSCRIRTVAMESTNVSWIPLFQILEDRGLQVCLVNARHVKNVRGRNPKTLAKLQDRRIKASAETVAKSLVGDCRPEHLFTFVQALAGYHHCQQLMQHCDRESQRRLENFYSKAYPPPVRPLQKRTP